MINCIISTLLTKAEKNQRINLKIKVLIKTRKRNQKVSQNRRKM